MSTSLLTSVHEGEIDIVRSTSLTSGLGYSLVMGKINEAQHAFALTLAKLVGEDNSWCTS